MTDQYGNELLDWTCLGRKGYARRINNDFFQFAEKISDFEDRYAPKCISVDSVPSIGQRNIVQSWLDNQNLLPFWGENGQKIFVTMYYEEPIYIKYIDSTHVAMARDIKDLGGSFTIFHIGVVCGEVEEFVKRKVLGRNR